MMEIVMAEIVTMPVSKPVPDHMPQGKNMLAKSEKTSNCFIIVASSIIASCRPEYSRSMASWIMVSSRWVEGLSTGIRPVSAMMMIKNATTANKYAGEIAPRPDAEAVWAISPRFVEPALIATANMESIIAGSTRAATNISLLEPIPPKALPVSSPTSTTKNRATAKRYITAMMSPAKPKGRDVVYMGIMRPAESMAANEIMGVAENIQEAVWDTTCSFLNSFARSEYV